MAYIMSALNYEGYIKKAKLELQGLKYQYQKSPDDKILDKIIECKTRLEYFERALQNFNEKKENAEKI